MYRRIPLSCSRMRSISVSLSSSRARRATWTTSSRLIIGAGSARPADSVGGLRRGAPRFRSAYRDSLQSDFLKLSVLERELLAAHRREADGDERVTTAPLDADHEPLAPAAVADGRADHEGQVVGALIRVQTIHHRTRPFQRPTGRVHR